jgi:hypothetical protein
MPSVNSYAKVRPPVDEAVYKSQLEKMIQTHWNQPSIVMWVVFNEGQGKHNVSSLVSTVKTIDPSRLVNQDSGGNNGAGDILDVHNYPSPSCATSATQILVCGEYGGVAYDIAGHMWKSGFGHGKVTSGAEWLDSYSTFTDNLIGFKINNGLSAAVYTELTDVEGEMNGFITYDRAVVKADLEKLSAINRRVIKNNAEVVEILPTSQVNAQIWKYTTSQPSADWCAPAFNDDAWIAAPALFGGPVTKRTRAIKTEWITEDIWMRKQFDLGALTPQSLDGLVLIVNHDEACEIYINGVLTASLKGKTNGYAVLPFTPEGKKAIKQNSQNVIAVHCHKLKNEQFIDAGISIRSYN